jgi:Protein of unknwon function (DUF3310)
MAYPKKMENVERVNDPVNHPSHYTTQVPGIECIDVTRWFTSNRGNAIKYIWRAGSKGDPVEDLRKAIFYLNNEIERIQVFGE